MSDKKTKFKWMKKFKLPYIIHIMRGDKFSVRHRTELKDRTGRVYDVGEKELVSVTMKKDMQVDTVGIFKFKDWEGIQEGYGGVFGIGGDKK